MTRLARSAQPGLLLLRRRRFEPPPLGVLAAGLAVVVVVWLVGIAAVVRSAESLCFDDPIFALMRLTIAVGLPVAAVVGTGIVAVWVRTR